MPGRNINKFYLDESFYHVYSRGVNKELIFKDNDDYAVFLNLFKRYLSHEQVKDLKGRAYPCLKDQLELLSFCLMPNHIHLLIYQTDSQGITNLMKGVLITYGMYFNKKYNRVGPLFQSRFRASMITNDSYLQHISRYIHLNPKDYTRWEFSSLPYYLNEKSAEWCRPKRIMELFDNKVSTYRKFVSDYEASKKALDEIKYELANY